jgi:predicted nucleic acid-binding Zn ribbon protein
MRRSNVQNIGEVISELLKEMQIDQKLKEIGVINSWGEVLGPNISRATTKIVIKNKVLFVSLSSPVVRNELLMLKSKIIKALNDKAGTNVIDDLVLK